MNQPSDPYRSSEFNAKAYCDEQIREQLDKRFEVVREEVQEDVKKLLKQPREMGDNVLYASIWRYVAFAVIVATISLAIGMIHSHNTDVQIEHEKTERIAREEAKEMWVHMNALLGLDGGK